MLNLKKVTLQYSPYEDRIRMMAEPEGGEPVAFLLTLRMSRALAGMLCNHLERALPPSSPVSRDMQLACRQRDAEWKLQPSEPVSFSSSMYNYLPEKFDLSCSPQSAAIKFPAGDDIAELRMNLIELRQLLSVLCRIFRKAGWPMDAWPEWFITEGPVSN